MKIVPPKPFTLEGGKRAVLLLHAFTGSPADVRMLARFLNKKGYTCHAPMYKGHGVPPEELMETSWEDWWQDVEKAYDHLKNEGYEEIAVCGLSLGGLFSLKVGYTFDVKGIVPMCAPMTVHGNVDRLHAGVLQYAKEQKKLEKKSAEQVEQEIKEFKELPLDTLESINELIEEIKDSLDMVFDPMMVVQAKNDEMVELKSAEIIHDEASSDRKELKWYENSTHVITLGPEKDQLHEEIYQFLENLDWEVDK